MSAGLSSAEAAARLQREGPNELPASKPKTNLSIVLHVLREPMFLLLLGAGSVYLVLGALEETIALTGAILLVIGIAVYQERKTERTLQALRDLSSPRALVIRDGQRMRIAGREVVRGDILVLTEGDRVAADAFVVSTVNLSIDESLITGESVSVKKRVWDGAEQMPRPGGDDSPAVYSGTMIVQGHGMALVHAIGAETEIGKLGRALQTIDVETTTIERETRSVVRFFASFGLGLCGVVAVVYGVTQGNWLRGALAGLALAISMTPEEFPVVLTVFLALGAWRISKRRVLTRRIPAIEMLGAATVLCVDKTGTLTMNRMAVRDVEPAPGRDRATVLEAAMHASVENPVDPMEKALHEAAADSNLHANASVDLIREYALSRDLLVMSRVLRIGGTETLQVFSKGAPEAIARVCKLPAEQIVGRVQAMGGRGLRVIGVARGRLHQKDLPDSQEQLPLEFLGLIGLEDPVRASVPAAIRECDEAGIRVVMITGDYPATANSIARQIGLKNASEIITGTELNNLSAEDLQARLSTVNTFARVMPEQKLRLVQAFKVRGEIVAMTGDGVNDAAALKAAHIGIAMGGRGTDVAREAAALVLLDDDFSSIVEAVRLGRRIYANLRKAMTYVCAIHVPIAGLSLLPVLFRLPLILMPLHIVFLELVIDPACSVAFESEPEHPSTMKRPPRDPKALIFDKSTIRSAAFQGFSLFFVAITAFLISLYRGQGEYDARAISFTTLVLGNLALIWANRSASRTIPEMIRARNYPLWTITGGALLVLATILYVPSIRDVFQFSTLHLNDIVICVLLAMFSVTGIELRKLLGRNAVH